MGEDGGVYQKCSPIIFRAKNRILYASVLVEEEEEINKEKKFGQT